MHILKATPFLRATPFALAASALLACTHPGRPDSPPPRKTSPAPQAAPAPKRRPTSPPARNAKSGWDLRRVTNLERVGHLTARQRRLLQQQGFFLAPQPSPKPSERASHLFHVYERNDYIAFPSFVTVDLAIDATHAYFDALLREVESQHLIPWLEKALKALLTQAEQVRRSARTARGRQVAGRAVMFWGTALRLLEQPAPGDVSDAKGAARAGAPVSTVRPTSPRLTPIPRAVRRKVAQVVARVQAAHGPLPHGVLRTRVDLTQMRPRGHYNRNGKLQRFFRSMSWLGMARFPLSGPNADVAAVALLARSFLGTSAGRQGLERVKAVSAFFAGGPDAADLDAAARLLVAVQPGAARATADALVRPALLKRYAAKLATLRPPRVTSTATSNAEGPEMRVLGRRAFEDTVALQRLVGALEDIASSGKHPAALVQAPGALGSAAVLGSDLAKAILTGRGTSPQLKALGRAIDRGRKDIASVPVSRWSQDAYHGTLHALRTLLPAPAVTAPALLRTPGWRLRALQAFAGGWAELRHDTILYGEQSGAECDAPDAPPPVGWVEPVPALYARLAAMVGELDKRLRAAGVPLEKRSRSGHASPLVRKTQSLVRLLHFLRDAASQELRGTPLTEDQRKRITLIGGEVEWLLISLANADLLAKRDQDMAVVADVFTWRAAGKAVEVGVGHPDLIYALVPGPKGLVLARGAVMSYREFLQPVTRRLTDEAWRRQLAAGRHPPRPAWLKPVYAEPVPYVRVKGRGVDRCGASSGAGLRL